MATSPPARKTSAAALIAAELALVTLVMTPPVLLVSPVLGAVGGQGYKPAASQYRSVAQSGSAPRSGRGGRRFKSCHSDQNSLYISIDSVSGPKPPSAWGTVMGT